MNSTALRLSNCNNANLCEHPMVKLFGLPWWAYLVIIGFIALLDVIICVILGYQSAKRTESVSWKYRVRRGWSIRGFIIRRSTYIMEMVMFELRWNRREKGYLVSSMIAFGRLGYSSDV